MNREGLVKLERVRVRCLACGQQVEAMATDGRVKGYCAVVKQYVNFPIETQHIGKNPTAKIKKQDGMVSDYLRGVKTGNAVAEVSQPACVVRKEAIDEYPFV